MKTYIILVSGLIVMLVTQAGLAGTLVISGTVPDRGFNIVGSPTETLRLAPQPESNVRVFIAQIKSSSRTPQSVAQNQKSSDFSSINGWKELTGDQTITTSSLIKVEAP